MKVRDYMTSQVETVDLNDPVSSIRGGRLRYPVTKNGLFYGIVTQADLARKNARDDEPIGNYTITDAFSTHPDIDMDTLYAAARRAKYPIKFVPVIDHGLVVGCLTWRY